MRERSKSTPRIPVVSDSSSCGGYESAGSDRFQDEVSKKSVEDLVTNPSNVFLPSSLTVRINKLERFSLAKYSSKT